MTSVYITLAVVYTILVNTSEGTMAQEPDGYYGEDELNNEEIDLSFLDEDEKR